jgi:hypothetical protein
MLIAYYFMWHTGHPAPEQCEGCASALPTPRCAKARPERALRTAT